MSSPPTVQVALAGRADNVALVRELLTGLAEVAGFGDRLDDIKTAVSEACNNVVVHAYAGRAGPLEVDMLLLPGILEVIVRDHGVGIDSQDGAEEAAAEQMADRGLGHGLGLAVMRALSDQLELRSREPHGLEVVMAFAIGDGESGEPLDLAGEPDEFEWPAVPDGAVRVALAPAALSSGVVNRVVLAVAARAGFSIDRLSDAQLVADAIAAHLEPVVSGPRLTLALHGDDRRLELLLGPLKAGGSRSAVSSSTIAQLGPVIERLADEVDVRELADGEFLILVMRDALRASPTR